MGWKSGSKKTTTTTQKPRWVEQGAQQALGLATDYASREYTPYSTAERVAPLSANEQQAVRLAGEATGRYGEDIAAAREAIQAGTTPFTEADIDAYMNPYIKGALDPVSREIAEQTARERQQLAGSLSSRGAFSGSRAILADREAAELGAQRQDDLYKQGYAQAFESAADKFYRDQDNRIRGAESMLRLAGMESDLIDADTRRLMGTGQVQRSVEQAVRDFDYSQFIESRDWDVRQSQVITDALQGIRGSYGEKQTTKTKEKGSGLGQVLGAAATIAGVVGTGGIGSFASTLFTSGVSLLGGGPALGTPGPEAEAAMEAGVS